MRLLLVLIYAGFISCQGADAERHAKALPSWEIPTTDEDVLINRLSPHLLPESQDSFERNVLVDYILEKKWDMDFDPSGYFYHILEAGAGSKPVWGDRVSVHYSGFFLDGQMFDTSHRHKAPFRFYVGNVIDGWNKALTTLGEGGRGVFLIPSNLAYGSQGFRNLVPADQHLLFQIQLLKIESD